MSESLSPTELIDHPLNDPIVAIVRVDRDGAEAIREFHFTDIDVASTFISSFQHVPKAKRVELFTFAGAWDREHDRRAPTVVTPDDLSDSIRAGLTPIS